MVWKGPPVCGCRKYPSPCQLMRSPVALPKDSGYLYSGAPFHSPGTITSLSPVCLFLVSFKCSPCELIYCTSASRVPLRSKNPFASELSPTILHRTARFRVLDQAARRPAQDRPLVPDWCGNGKRRGPKGVESTWRVDSSPMHYHGTVGTSVDASVGLSKGLVVVMAPLYMVSINCAASV